MQWRSTPVIALALFGACILLAVTVGRLFFKDYALKKEIARLEERVASLQEKRLRSLELLQYIATDTYIEEEARSKLGLQKEGEETLIFGSSTPAPSLFEPLAAQLTTPKRWWYYFFAPERLE